MVSRKHRLHDPNTAILARPVEHGEVTSPVLLSFKKMFFVGAMTQGGGCLLEISGRAYLILALTPKQ